MSLNWNGYMATTLSILLSKTNLRCIIHQESNARAIETTGGVIVHYFDGDLEGFDESYRAYLLQVSLWTGELKVCL